MGFEQSSYASHAGHFAEALIDSKQRKLAETWFDETTADYWRHARAYECADCLALSDRSASWLTVGDGRWGLDSIRLHKRGFSRILPTDISEPLLEQAKARGLIDDYRIENAEHLSFEDKQFDYVFCKESLHHFPRPYLALYEMIRVARHGVFLIEPNDPTLGVQTKGYVNLRMLKDLPSALVKRLRGQPGLVHVSDSPERGKLRGYANWEDSGNFLYAFSRPEAEKVALGLNMPQLVIKGLNDHYVEGCEFEPADTAKSGIFREIVSKVAEMDAECVAGMREHSLLMVGFLLQPLSAIACAEFQRRGWEVIDLPRNPIIG